MTVPTRTQPNPPGIRRPRFDFLDGLRGFSALYVVFFHFLGWHTEGYSRLLLRLVYPVHFGHTAVSVFIVLSGFSLMLGPATAGGQLSEGFGAYIRRRARRILPPYYAAFLLSALSVYLLKYPFPNSDTAPGTWQNNLTVGATISHLLLIHNLAPGWAARINGILWSVATEWQIYFLFPLLLLPIWRRFGNAAVIVAAVLAGLVGLLPLYPGLDHQLISACPWYVGLFAIGMVGAAVTVGFAADGTTHGTADGPSDHAPATARLHRRLLLTALLLLIPLLAGLHFKTSAIDLDTASASDIRRDYVTSMLQDTAAGGIILCLILYLARHITHPFQGGKHSTARPHILLRVLESRAARTLAGFSYSLYLTHYIVFCALLRLEQYLHLPITIRFGLNAVVGIPAAVAFGYGFHLLFERPLQRRAKPSPSREEAAAAAAKVKSEERATTAPRLTNV